jgi:hypothetical protein
MPHLGGFQSAMWSLPMHLKYLLIPGLAIGLTLLPQASAAKAKISTQAMPGVNFSAYKTYAWVNSLPPAGMNPVMYQTIMMDIDSALAGLGYQKVADTGQLSMILTIGAREKTDIQSWGRFGLQTSVYQYTQGQLSLDAYDTNTKQALWHGQATETVNPSKPNQTKINAAVGQLMASFPATAAPAAAPAPAQ